MSLTPTPYYNGENTCTCCDKPMYVNDSGIVYRLQAGSDIMFCMPCAAGITMSLAQDIARVSPDTGLAYYRRFKHPGAPSINLRNHANALRKLAEKMDDYAVALDFEADLTK